MKTTYYNQHPSISPTKKRTLPSLRTPEEASIYQKPDAHRNGWLITGMFQLNCTAGAFSAEGKRGYIYSPPVFSLLHLPIDLLEKP